MRWTLIQAVTAVSAGLIWLPLKVTPTTIGGGSPRATFGLSEPITMNPCESCLSVLVEVSLNCKLLRLSGKSGETGYFMKNNINSIQNMYSSYLEHHSLEKAAPPH